MKHNKFSIWQHPTFKAIVVLLLIYLVLFAVFFIRKAPNGDRTVYTTSTGECYHTSGCSSLTYSKYRTTLSDAVDEGYRSCDNCDPPELNTKDKQINFSFWSIPLLVLCSLCLSYAICAVSAILFGILDIPSNQIKFIWYLISSAVFLVLYFYT